MAAPHEPPCTALLADLRVRCTRARWHPRPGEYDVRRIVPSNEHSKLQPQQEPRLSWSPW